MTSILQKIAKLAIDSYSTRSNERSFKAKFSKLTDLMTEVRVADINLNPELHEMMEILNENTQEFPPVSYVDICEHEKFTICMFVLKQGSKIPLHDHPGMWGIIRVLRGNVLLETYTADEAPSSELDGDFSFTATKTSEVLIGESDNVCVVTPKDNNLHEISAPNGTAAFLDVLFPPYHTENRVCNYYAVKSSSLIDAKKVVLTRIASPSYFWTVHISKYIGAAIVEQPQMDITV